MPSQDAKPLVLIIGGAGNTGKTLVESLLEYGAFRIATLTRPASASKPTVMAQKNRGVEIRLGDFARDSVESLVEALAGVDILISAVSAEAILDQKNVFEAAKRAGVKRIVPCDLATACPPGVRALHDEKLLIRSFIRQLGVPYTIIDVGWWMQLILPYSLSAPAGPLADLSHEFYGEGNIKTAVTDLKDVGLFVARIIDDPRTINQYVFCWGEEVTLDKTYEIAERVSGEKLSDAKKTVSAEEALRLAAECRAEYEQTHDVWAHVRWVYAEYAHSMFFRGDNTVEKAKAEGALDARVLYPDFKATTLEECAKSFYLSLPQFDV